jgi:multidrug efflux pump subunit AcrA (membrane-fusion protein)
MSYRSSAVLLSFLLLAACGGTRQPQGAASSEPSPVPVRVRKPNHVQRPSYVTASGTVEADLSVEVAFQVPGRVSSVRVEEGQLVRKGQLLATLDPRDYEYAAAGASAQLTAAQATAQKAQTGLRSQELEQARIDYDRWADEYKRMRTLYERKSLPENDFKKVEAAYNAARERYEMAKEGTRREDLAAANAAATGAQAQVDESRKRLSETKLLSPIDGFVGLRHIDPGEMVGAGMPVIAVMRTDPVKVRVGIPEAEIGKVRAGAPAVVSIPSLGGREFNGKVELVGVAAEPTSRTYAVKIIVPNPKHELKTGMVAEARIEGAGTVDALTIPGDAIVRDAQGVTLVYVYFPDRGRVYAHRVQPGTPIDKELEVQGLTGSEQVVTGGQNGVREGARVQVEGVAK